MVKQTKDRYIPFLPKLKKRDAWDDIKFEASISPLYWLYMQNNTILMSIYDEKIYTENIYIAQLHQMFFSFHLNVHCTVNIVHHDIVA